MILVKPTTTRSTKHPLTNLPAGPITLLLVEDDQIVCSCIKALLESYPRFRIIGEVHDGLDAVRAAANLSPDVMILDLSIPGLNGLEVARQVARRCRTTRIVVLSVHDDDSYVRQALKSHVVGYVTKDCPIHILIEAIDSVVSGKYYLSPSLTKKVIREYIKKNPKTDDDTDATSKSKK